MPRPNYRRKISLTPSEMAANRIASGLSGLLGEFRTGTLDESMLLCYFSEFLLDAGADSRIVVDVLERPAFGDEGQELALGIKVREGW